MNARRKHRTYFWAVLLDDEQTIMMQYDLETGKENKWSDIPSRRVSKIYWFPFSEDLERKINDDIVICTLNQSLEYDVPKGFEAVVKFDELITEFSYYYCTFCGQTTYYTGGIDHDGKYITLHCPNCCSQNDWYCERCQKMGRDFVVDEPIFVGNGVVNCPKCTEEGNPFGLLRTKVLAYIEDVDFETFYCSGHQRIVEVAGQMHQEYHLESVVIGWDNMGKEVYRIGETT